MQGIEKTLRDTLGKLESPDEATRIKLYKATETILERSLAPYIESQPEMVATRRTQLYEIVTRLESEYQNPAPEPVFMPDPAPEQLQEPPQEPVSAPVPDIPNVQANQPATGPGVSSNFPVIEPQATPYETSAPSVDTPQRPDIVSVDAPPVVNQPSHGSIDAPQIQAPIDDAVDLTSAPEIKPAQRSVKNSNVAWPDAATHPDRAEADLTTPVANGEINAAATKKSKSEIRAEKRAKRLREHEEKRQRKKDNRRRGRSLIDTIAGSIVSVILIIFLIGGACKHAPSNL